MMKLRENIASEIANAYCHECDAGEEHLDIADRILAIPEIAEALKVVESPLDVHVTGWTLPGPPLEQHGEK